MRKLMGLLAAFTLAAGLSVASSLPASAATTLCETSGSYCVGSASLDLGALALERTPGRSITFDADGESYEGFSAGTLELTGATNRCLTSVDEVVTIEQCSGVTGVVWAEETINNHKHFINEYETNLNHANFS